MTAEAPSATPDRVSPRRLDPLLRPRSVVVVGASPNPSFVSGIFKNLLRAGFAGEVAAVNPRYDSLHDARCYASVLDVPWSIDLVVVGVSWRAMLPSLLEQCAQRRVGALVVITSGFAESGTDGLERQRQLCAWAERTGTPIGGPNCLGLMHAPSGFHALPSTFIEVVPGEIGLILQSGMMAPSVLTPLFARNIGITFAVTTGNEADVDLADYIRYYVDDPATRIIGCFAEQIKRPAAFMAACELAADARKPIVMLKIGRSAAGQRAALAHTGSLVGADEVIDTVLRKLGVTRVASLDELFEALAVFHTRRLPRGPGLAAISVSGGAAGLMSDLASGCGVHFPELAAQTQRTLREVVPEFGNVGNPLDVTGQGVFQADLLEKSLDLLAGDPGVDTIVYARPFAARFDGATPAYSALLRAIEHNPAIPFVAMSLAGGHFFPSVVPDTPMQQPVDRLDGVPCLQGAEYGLRAVAALTRYAAFLRQRSSAGPSFRRRSARTAADGARAILNSAVSPRLSSLEGSALLTEYGIPTPTEELATSQAEAVAVAERVGYPVAVKVEAPSLAHKARAGGVALNLAAPEAVAAAYDRLQSVAPGSRGVLIQHMVSESRAEVIVGMSHDPQFGPIVAVGLGGVFVEALRDVQLLLPPVSPEQASAALSSLRAARALEGADSAAIVDVVIRFSELCADVGDAFQAIDLNPLMVGHIGGGAIAVDSLFEPRLYGPR